MCVNTRLSRVGSPTRFTFYTSQRLSKGNIDSGTVSWLFMGFRRIHSHSIRFISGNGPKCFMPVNLSPSNFQLKLCAAGETRGHRRSVRCPRKAFRFGNRVSITKNIGSISTVVLPANASNNNNSNSSSLPFLFRPINGYHSIISFTRFVDSSHMRRSSFYYHYFTHICVDNSSSISRSL